MTFPKHQYIPICVHLTMASVVEKSYDDVARMLGEFGLGLSPSDKQLVDLTAFPMRSRLSHFLTEH